MSEEKYEALNDQIDKQKKVYKCCVLWSTIPLLSWFVPFIGHAAISDSKGTIYDFQGSYSIGEHKHNTCFGKVRKCVKLNVLNTEQYDNAIKESNEKFSHLTHNLIVQNCHDHVCEVLNRIEYNGKSNWDDKTLVLFMIKEGKYLKPSDIAHVYLPFALFLLFFIVFICLLFLII